MSAPLPWIMPLTKREVIVWSEGAEQYVCITKATLPKGMYSSLDTVDFDIAGYNINHISDLGSLTGRLHLDHGHTIIHPLYAK